MSSKQQIKDYPDVLDINQMCSLIGVGLTTGYKLIRSERFHQRRLAEFIKYSKRM